MNRTSIVMEALIGSALVLPGRAHAVSELKIPPALLPDSFKAIIAS